MYGMGNYSIDECKVHCGEFIFEKVDTVSHEIDSDEEICHVIDEDDCQFRYVYYYPMNSNVLHIRAQKERECQPQVFIPGIILGVIAGVVLIGLAFLLLWKLFTTISDRREFARFEKERMMAKWDTVSGMTLFEDGVYCSVRATLMRCACVLFFQGENPIYKQATSTFKNPTYAGK